MKKKLFLSLCFLCLSLFMTAQDSSMGMKYQAMARDAQGEIISNEAIEIKAKLFAISDRETVYYEEIHSTKSNDFGLVNIIIGEGISSNGVFAEIPWDEENIWIEVAVKRESDAAYLITTSSDLLSVPYAQYAFKSKEIFNNISFEEVLNLDIGRNYTDDHLMPEAFQWNTLGNEWALYNAPFAPKIGTTDYTPLSLITNNTERMKITEDGDIFMPGNLTVSGILTAENDVFFNLDQPGGGSTFIYGATTIGGSGMNLVTFTGDVQMDKSLSVGGQTTLNDFALIKDNQASFLGKFENTNTANGDGIQIKLGRTHGAWDGSDYVSVPNPIVDVFDGGAETIKGWVTGDAFEFTDVFTFIPAAYIAGTLCQLANSLVIDNLNDGLNLPVQLGPYGVPEFTLIPEICTPDPLDTGVEICTPEVKFPAITVIPQFTLIPAIPQIPCGGLPSLSFPNVEISDVTNSLTADNQFISFKDVNDRELGSIRAQSIGNWADNYFDGLLVINFIGSRSGVVGLDPLDIFVGLTTQISLIADGYNTIGVSYESGHGDYAEWLERENPEERIGRGDIVAVKAGKITKDLNGAEQVMVVSQYPIMLGNEPTKEEAHLGNKVAFIGQVPVKVLGPVSQGDYIIADDKIPGYGMAKSQTDLQDVDLRNIVGRSWDSNENEGPKTVNVVVGVHNGEYFNILKQLKQRHQANEEKLNQLDEKVAEFDRIISKSTN